MSFIRKFKDSITPRDGVRGREDLDKAGVPLDTHCQESDKLKPPHHTATEIEHQEWSNSASRIAVQGNQTIYGDQHFHIQPVAHRKSSSVADSDRSYTESEKNCLASLSTDAMYGRAAINSPLNGTLEWLHGAPAFQPWSWSSPASAHILLVSGHAGSGKSVLARHVADSLAEGVSTGVLVYKYFFDGTVPGQCDPVLLLRSLIQQIVSSHPKLLRVVWRAAEVQGHQFYHLFSALSTAFLKLITHERLHGAHIILDAIDECEENAQARIVEWMATVIHATASQPIKILVTSRHGSRAVQVFNERFPDIFSRLRLENESELISQDVEKLIQERVRGLQRAGKCTPSVADKLARLLTERVDGGFLWISLALSILERRRLIKETDIKKIAAELPLDLVQLYELVFSQIPEEDHELVEKTLYLIVASARHLTISELNVMLVIDDSHLTAAQVRKDYALADTESVENLLGTLIKVVDSRVMLVHHTLEEYVLDSNRLGKLFAKEREGSPDFCIAEACIRYLLLEDVVGSNPDETDSDTGSSIVSPIGLAIGSDQETADYSTMDLESLFQESGQGIGNFMNTKASGFELYDYAARYWSLHFRRCNSSEALSLEAWALELYQDTTLSGWFEYYTSVNDEAGDCPLKPDNLTLSCYLGHQQIAGTLIHEQSDSTDLGSVCYWAAATGHTQCLEELSACEDGDLSSFSHQSHSALTIAAKKGHLDCVDNLLASGRFSVNLRGPRRRNPLSLAAGAGHDHIIARLLKEPDVDVNIPDHTGASPISWAVAADSPSTIEILLRHGKSNVEALDVSNRSALSWACEYGSLRCVKILLKQGVTMNTQDTSGKTPLMHAVITGDLQILRRLVKHDATSLHWTDNSGRNAISWAAQGRHSDILAFLLEHASDGASVKDKNGWAPIAWTLDKPERPRNAELLMPYIIEELKDGAWVTVFEIALRWGAFAVAKLMIENEGLDNARDELGCTALWYAADMGQVEFVRCILERSVVRVSIGDGDGDTAYSRAALHQYEEICELFLQYRGE